VRKIATPFAVGFIFVLSLVCAAQNGKVETVGPLTDKAVPEGVRQVLDSKGYRLTLDGGAPPASCGCARASLHKQKRM
jgi:hypothetical protein